MKVFLFKQGHIDRYIKLGKKDQTENRTQFAQYAKASIPWLEMEISIAQPFVIILLGVEVTATVGGISEKPATAHLDGKPRPVVIGKQKVTAIALPHPGILMRHSKDNPLTEVIGNEDPDILRQLEKNPWPERFAKEIAPTAKAEILKLRQAAMGS